MTDNVGNYRSPAFDDFQLSSNANIMRTPLGNIRNSQMPPPLPPPVMGYQSQIQSPYSNIGYGGMTSPYFGSGYNSFNSFGGYGGGFNSFSGYGAYGGYNSLLNQNDYENQFIRLAEESSRPAFQSIGSLVATIGNVAAMLDSTFFAITSSFRALLGVAANFGRLRGMFSEFWHTFGVFKWITWAYKKLLYWLKLSNIDPSSIAFGEAFAAAQNQAFSGAPAIPPLGNNPSPWPVLVFLSFIFAAPYIIMKLLGNLTTSVLEKTRNPSTWVRPVSAKVAYDFPARNSSELNIKAGQTILIAPKEIQNTHRLMNTGWALASVDGKTAGLVPVSYLQKSNQSKIVIPTESVERPFNGVSNEYNFEAAEIPNTKNNQINNIKPKSQHVDKQLPTIPELNESVKTA